jgi:hypothetical protein
MKNIYGLAIIFLFIFHALFSAHESELRVVLNVERDRFRLSPFSDLEFSESRSKKRKNSLQLSSSSLVFSASDSERRLKKIVLGQKKKFTMNF